MRVTPRVIQLTIVAVLALSGLVQTKPEEPMTSPSHTPTEGGCLIEDATVQSNHSIVRSPVIVVRRRRSSRQFPDPNLGPSSSPEGKAIYGNETMEVVESVNLVWTAFFELVR